MEISWGTIVATLIGAAVSLGTTTLMDWRKDRRELTRRWDVELFKLCSELTAAARSINHIGDERRKGRQVERGASLDDEHLRLRKVVEALHLVGDHHVVKRAELVRRHAYAVVAVAEGRPDPRAAEFEAIPSTRLREALDDFYEVARRQLRANSRNQPASSGI